MPDNDFLTETQQRDLQDLLAGVMARAGADTRDLVAMTGYSKSAISLIRNGKRNFSSRFARSLATAIGGTQGDWLAAYAAIRAGKWAGDDRALARFRPAHPTPLPAQSFTNGRLVNRSLKEILTGGGRAAILEGCAVSRIGPATYDTLPGQFGPPSRGRPAGEVTQTLAPMPAILRLMPGEAKVLASREALALPDWIEADVAPAEGLARKPLHIGTAAWASPGARGPLLADLRNISDAPVEISAAEPFLGLRLRALPRP